ncbi:hypothetical protein SDC9_203179 [bioreactor metagenome]|uniref:Uncharacterized protein n=1 Tax=bioreactor metagenome TaxID=1076179 RepID=A0A645IWC8_9ZZZZ
MLSATASIASTPEPVTGMELLPPELVSEPVQEFSLGALVVATSGSWVFVGEFVRVGLAVKLGVLVLEGFAVALGFGVGVGSTLGRALEEKSTSLVS